MNKKYQLKALASRMKPMHLNMAIAISEGKKQHEAYTIAGGKGNDPIKCATGLIKTNPDISIYAELSKECVVEEAQLRGLWTLEEKAKKLESLADLLLAVDGDKGVIDAANAIKAMAEHNKMTGDLAAIKSESTNIEVSQEDWLDSLS